MLFRREQVWRSKVSVFVVRTKRCFSWKNPCYHFLVLPLRIRCRRNNTKCVCVASGKIQNIHRRRLTQSSTGTYQPLLNIVLDKIAIENITIITMSGISWSKSSITHHLSLLSPIQQLLYHTLTRLSRVNTALPKLSAF